MTLFEIIDGLEPLIPDSEINAANYARFKVWRHEHPEQYKAIVKRHNDKRKGDRKNDRTDGDSGVHPCDMPCPVDGLSVGH